MSFNPDPLKQAQEVLFSNIATKTNHPNIIFNGNTVQNSASEIINKYFISATEIINKYFIRAKLL